MPLVGWIRQSVCHPIRKVYGSPPIDPLTKEFEEWMDELGGEEHAVKPGHGLYFRAYLGSPLSRLCLFFLADDFRSLGLTIVTKCSDSGGCAGNLLNRVFPPYQVWERFLLDQRISHPMY